jgi:hypothetical protein
VPISDTSSHRGQSPPTYPLRTLPTSRDRSVIPLILPTPTRSAPSGRKGRSGHNLLKRPQAPEHPNCDNEGPTPHLPLGGPFRPFRPNAGELLVCLFSVHGRTFRSNTGKAVRQRIHTRSARQWQEGTPGAYCPERRLPPFTAHTPHRRPCRAERPEPCRARSPGQWAQMPHEGAEGAEWRKRT